MDHNIEYHLNVAKLELRSAIARADALGDVIVRHECSAALERLENITSGGIALEYRWLCECGATNRAGFTGCVICGKDRPSGERSASTESLHRREFSWVCTCGKEWNRDVRQCLCGNFAP